MSREQQQLEAAISALSGQRTLLGDALVDAALGPMRVRLASLSSEQSLKHVTILFLDVVGSTTLSQILDPEEVHLTMDRLLEQCAAIVESHRGKVLKYAGDSVLAVFGADETREDDAERAVMAGLALLQEGKRQGALIAGQYGHAGFDVRIGLHSGGVLLGGGVDAQSNIRGFHVNVAARMEQTAPVGGLRISHDTYRHVRGVFDVEPQPPIQVKGVEAPLLTYLVRRSKPRAFRMPTRGIEGVETRMVGRDGEMELLQTAFGQLYTRRQFSVVHIVAEAGLGKSRLLHEFENWAESQAARFYFFQGRAHAAMQSQPYGLLRDIFAWRFQIADGDTAEVCRKKFEEGLGPDLRDAGDADMAQSHVHLLGHLIGIDYADSKHVLGIQDDSRQARSRGFHAAALWFRHLADGEGLPILLLLDDMHWADDGSLDFLNYLSEVSRELPMLAIATSRHRGNQDQLQGPWGADALQISMVHLDQGASHMLASELLKMLPEIPGVLHQLITSGAQGNPFYMEELIKMLIDEGAIETSIQHWTVHPEKFLSTRVPPTLTGVLQSRLDRLRPEEKRALQQASVIGQVFWDQPLAALSAEAVQALPALLHHRLIFQKMEASIEGAREFTFSHQILHQVTYETLLKTARRTLHAKAANWFAEMTGARAKDFLSVAAENFLKADDLFQSGAFYTKAAEHATKRYAHATAIAYVDKAWELLPLVERQTDPPDAGELLDLRWRLLDVREQARDIEGKRTEQRADIEALQELADASRQDGKRCEVAWRRSNLALRTGNYLSMRDAARQAMDFAERTGNALLSLRGQQRLAIALTYLGDAEAGRALALDGLSKARVVGARALEAMFLNALSVIADRQEDQLASLELDAHDLAINRELGNRRNEAVALNNLGNGWLRLGAHQLARQYLKDGLRLARALGDRTTEPNTLIALAVLDLREGKDERALEHAQAAVALLANEGSPDFEAIAMCTLGDVHLARNQPYAARSAFKRAYDFGVRLDSPAQFDATAGLARVALAISDIPEALQLVNELMACTENGQNFDGSESPIMVRLTCYEVLQRVSDRRADTLLETAYSELQKVAVTLNDSALRQGYLHDIPEHHQTVSAWQALRGHVPSS